MDTGYTYSARGTLERLSLYAPPAFEPPPSITVTRNGVAVEFVRLSDLVLTCGAVAGTQGSCASYECHRRVIGDCQCGRHKGLLDRDPNDARPRIEVRVHDEGPT